MNKWVSRQAMDVAFNEVQKAALCLSVLGPAGVWVGMYVYARQRLPKEQGENDVMMYIYAAAAGILLGQVLGHVLPNALLGSWMDIKFLMIGASIVIMMAIYRLVRVCGSHIGPDPLLEPSAAIDRETQEERDYVEIDPAQEVHVILDILQAKDQLRLHRFIGWLVYAVFIFSLIIEGLIVIYNPRGSSPGGLVAAFWIGKVLQSMCMAGYAVYSRLHRQQSTGRIKVGYTLMASIWCIAVFLSTLPVLLDVDRAMVMQIVEHPALGLFYSLFGGVILVISFQFLFTSPRIVDRLETVISIGLVSVGFASMWAIGLWI